MTSYRGTYIGGLLQKPERQDDYYDPNDPFGSADAAQPADPNKPPSLDPNSGTSSMNTSYGAGKATSGMPGGTSNPVETPEDQHVTPETTTTELPDPNAPIPPTTTSPPTSGPDTSKYDTDGYNKPQYVPESYGNAPPGWDQTKWSDPNHQSPKYAVGRILVANGDLRDPNNRTKAIEDIKKAYPGTQFNGKDKISIDGGKTWVDIFGGASAGVYSPAWQPDEGSSGGSAIQQWSGAGGMPNGMPPLPESASDQTTRSEYNSLLRKYLRRSNGNQQSNTI